MIVCAECLMLIDVCCVQLQDSGSCWLFTVHRQWLSSTYKGKYLSLLMPLVYCLFVVFLCDIVLRWWYSRRRHSIFRLSVHLCMRRHILQVCWHQIYILGAVGDEDELIRFWGQRSSHSETTYGQKSTLGMLKVIHSNFNIADNVYEGNYWSSANNMWFSLSALL